MQVRFVSEGRGDVVAVMAAEGGDLLGAGVALDTAMAGRIKRAMEACAFHRRAGPSA